ncbi:hypothetical protein [Streptomyces sp. NPDC058272]|uniref:hypothetical protein n=1 Tax=Streptomyces sp. NPDC058272 TaxID=3346415 RepID=UPI0036EF0B1B
MGVFDGGTYQVSVRRRDDSEEDEYTSNPHELVEKYRTDPDVKAVLTCWIHYVTGETESDLSFGDFWGDEEDEDE